MPAHRGRAPIRSPRRAAGTCCASCARPRAEALDCTLLSASLARRRRERLVLDARHARPRARSAQALWRLREIDSGSAAHGGREPQARHLRAGVARCPHSSQQASAWVAAHVPAGVLVAYGHAGDGNLHFNVSSPAAARPRRVPRGAEPGMRRAIHDLRREIRRQLQRRARHRPAQGRRARSATADPVELALMRE